MAPAGRLLLALALTRLCHGAVVDLIVITGEQAACPEDFEKVDHKESLNGDFNQGSKGAFIWLCVKTGPEEDGITDLVVVAGDGAIDSGCGAAGTGWARVRQEQGSNGDFNQGAGGKYIYLCYNKDKGRGGPLVQLNTHESDCEDGMFRVKQAGDSDGDFNQGAKGKYIYLCARRSCLASSVQGQWQQRYVIAAPTKETWKHGTQKRNEESKTEDWSESVSAKVSQSWSLFGAEGSVEITGTYAHQTSSTYSSEWTTSDEHTFEITWSEEQVGKQSWQFVFFTSDSCQHEEQTLVQDFAVTEGAWRPPCCVPGFATDMPAYTTCHSADVMVRGGQQHGCKVAERAPQRPQGPQGAQQERAGEVVV